MEWLEVGFLGTPPVNSDENDGLSLGATEWVNIEDELASFENERLKLGRDLTIVELCRLEWD